MIIYFSCVHQGLWLVRQQVRRSADEGGRHAFLRHGEPVFLASEGDAAHEENHAFREGTHHLEPFEILRRFARLSAVDAVPVLPGGNRHAGNGKVFIQFIKSGRQATKLSFPEPTANSVLILAASREKTNKTESRFRSEAALRFLTLEHNFAADLLTRSRRIALLCRFSTPLGFILLRR